MSGFGAGCLIIHDWHVLLGQRGARQREPLTWAPFGGRAEPGEGLVACMLREVREEAGIALDPARCAYLHTHRGPGVFPFHTFVAFPRACPSPLLSDESLDAAWFPLGPSASGLWRCLPSPVHSGLAALAASPAAAAILSGMGRSGPRPRTGPAGLRPRRTDAAATA